MSYDSVPVAPRCKRCRHDKEWHGWIAMPGHEYGGLLQGPYYGKCRAKKCKCLKYQQEDHHGPDR